MGKYIKGKPHTVRQGMSHQMLLYASGAAIQMIK